MMNYNPYPQRYPVQNNSITWVQGIEGAKAFQLMPNSNIVLLDSENEGIFYIKVSDNVGMCNLRVFKYEEMNTAPTPQAIDTSQFVTKAELQEAINAIKGGMNNEQTVPATKSKQKSLISE